MIRIYLTNLRKYNNNHIVGKWVELPVSDDEMAGVLKEIGIDDESGYFISDFECDVPGIHINKNLSIDELNDMADQLNDLDEDEIKVCSTIMKNENCTLDEAIDQKDSRVVITLNKNVTNSDVDFACSYIEQVYGDVNNMDKETLARYFDFESFGQDLKMNFNTDEEETIAVSNN
ncbi:MAG: antirestriction protein ArdA [Inconstantimicrobium porci]|uniref:antirestriction protein ArdA n=1 Tax=Inconstantimicrobium porci TaxID=2652291 RepID=UPI002A91617A|nr:antirestriction protein ArdA [Inconstantimicrobium porci]MDY5912602.1 antirestriction protein ArdA [Inconstantimicrobium porci]